MKDHTVKFASTVLNRNVDIRMLIPNGSALKCLVLLHGYNGDHNQWVTNSDLAHFAAQMGIAVFMPSCANGYYEDTREDMPRFIGEELVGYIRSEFPVSGLRKETYIAGVSMGGFGALLIGSKYPHVFGKIASFSGAFIIHDVVIGNPGVLGNANPQYFFDVFGELEDLENSSRDPIAEAIRAAEAGRLGKVCLICGERDVLISCNKTAKNRLQNANADLTWYFDQNGDHRWPFWNDMLPHICKWLAEGKEI